MFNPTLELSYESAQAMTVTAVRIVITMKHTRGDVQKVLYNIHSDRKMMYVHTSTDVYNPPARAWATHGSANSSAAGWSARWFLVSAS